jgi:hypothetical protein
VVTGTEKDEFRTLIRAVGIDTAEQPTMFTLPLVLPVQGVPSLYVNVLNASGLLDPIGPTAENLKFSTGPAPVSGAVPYAEMISVPGVMLLTVIVSPLLSVPAPLSETKVSTAGSYVMRVSYESTPWPVTSVVVTGTENVDAGTAGWLTGNETVGHGGAVPFASPTKSSIAAEAAKLFTVNKNKIMIVTVSGSK